MMKFFCSFILLLVFSLAQISAPLAQQQAAEKPVQGKENTSDKTPTEEKVKVVLPKIPHPLPFKIGENLLYDVSFERLIFSGSIGDMIFSVSKAENNQADLMTLKVDLVSKGFFPSLFGIKVKDQFSAVVNKGDFGLFSSSKLRQEGKTNTEEKNQVNRKEGRVTYTFRDLANTEAQPKVVETECPNWVQDIISAIYFLRTQELKEGAVIPIPITDHGQNYVIDAVIGKREEVKVDAGKFKTFKVETKAFSGRLIRKSGELFLWFSDDARRLPVKARVKVSGTTVNIELKKIQQLNERPANSK
jgi:hypothetical protein